MLGVRKPLAASPPWLERAPCSLPPNYTAMYLVQHPLRAVQFYSSCTDTHYPALTKYFKNMSSCLELPLHYKTNAAFASAQETGQFLRFNALVLL